ncbi:MAG: hypothetical protein ACRD0H_28280 [Actinomycetes bacterium]
MTAQPAVPGPDQHEVIHLGGQAAVVVPVEEYQRLRALERHASAQDLDAAEAEAAAESFEAWVASGRPGALSHEEAMAVLLGETR